MTERTPTTPPRWDGRLEVVDLLPDQLALARSQIGSGLYGLAEGVLLRLIAGLEAAGKGGLEELTWRAPCSPNRSGAKGVRSRPVRWSRRSGPRAWSGADRW